MRLVTLFLLFITILGCTGSEQPLFKAVQNRDFSRVEKLLKKDISIASIKNKDGDTPLHLAVKLGEIKIVELFIKYKANLNIQDMQGNTPLLLATTYGYYPMVKDLLLAKADLTILNNHASNGAKIALEANKPEILKLYLEQGVVKQDYYPKLTNKLEKESMAVPFGDIENRVLMAINQKNFEAFTELLDDTDHPVNYLAQDNNGRTLLSTIATLPESDYLVYYLTKDRSALDLQDKSGINPLMLAITAKNVNNIRQLILAGANLRTTDKEFKNILHYAVITADLPTFNIIINNFKALNDQDIQGNTPLHYASALLDNTDILQALLESGANVNIENKINRDTPLHIAVKSANALAVEQLIKFGANSNIQNAEGKTPRDFAIGTPLQESIN